MNLKNIYKPDQKFKAETKSLFLANFSEKFANYPKASFAFKYFIRGVGVGVSFAIILSFTAIYADQRNVGPESVLYGFKRSQEAVNLTLSNEEEKPEAHAKLAERRLNEIKAIQNKDPKSPLITGLKNDLAREVKSSIQTLKSSSRPKFTAREEFLGHEEKIQPSQTSTTGAPAVKLKSEKPSASNTPREMSAVKSLDKKNSKLCKSWNQIISGDGDLILEAVYEDEEVLEWFEVNCFLDPSVFSEKSDLNEVFEIESEKKQEDHE